MKRDIDPELLIWFLVNPDLSSASRESAMRFFGLQGEEEQLEKKLEEHFATHHPQMDDWVKEEDRESFEDFCRCAFTYVPYDEDESCEHGPSPTEELRARRFEEENPLERYYRED